MTFIVLSRSVPGIDRSALVDHEYPLVERLHGSGFFDQIYVRTDGYGAIAVIEADSAEAVRDQLSSMPFFVHGAVEIEHLLEVHPRW